MPFSTSRPGTALMRRVRSASLAVMMLLVAPLPVTAPARAEEMEAYWLGFTLGSGITICEFFNAKILSPDLTREFLKGVRGGSNIPATPKAAAFKELEKLYPNCPLN